MNNDDGEDELTSNWSIGWCWSVVSKHYLKVVSQSAQAKNVRANVQLFSVQDSSLSPGIEQLRKASPHHVRLVSVHKRLFYFIFIFIFYVTGERQGDGGREWRKRRHETKREEKKEAKKKHIRRRYYSPQEQKMQGLKHSTTMWVTINPGQRRFRWDRSTSTTTSIILWNGLYILPTKAHHATKRPNQRRRRILRIKREIDQPI